MYNRVLAFEWDADKAMANARKHGVMFSTEAVGVFSDDYAITIADDESDWRGEQRLVTVGIGNKGRLLVVVYSYRGENIRLISARLAEPHEGKQYEAER
jgi:uncharacterized DUF497 family protein